MILKKKSCENISGFKTLKEAYDYVQTDTPIGQHVTYDEFCTSYEVSKDLENNLNFVQFTNSKILPKPQLNFSFQHFRRFAKAEVSPFNLKFIRKMYSLAKDFAGWMANSGFPETFPPSTSLTGKLCHNCLNLVKYQVHFILIVTNMNTKIQICFCHHIL